MRMPLCAAAISFIIGIIIGSSMQIPDSHLLFALTALISLLLPAIMKKIHYLSATILVICFALLGILGINPHLYFVPDPFHVANLDYAGPVHLEGVVSEPPERGPNKADLILEATRIVQNGCSVPVNGRVLLSVDGVGLLPVCGDLIRTRVKLKTPRNFNNPGRFDYERFLRLKGILVRGFIDSPSRIAIIRQTRGNPATLTLERFRNHLAELIRRHAPAAEAPVLIAMVLGEQREIPKEILTVFNRTGTTHILAISGFNIGIVFLIFILFFSLLAKSSQRLLLYGNALKAALVLAVIPVVLYAFIAGMGMSVLRAAIMIAVLALALIAGREGDLPNTLSLAALAILACYPPALFDVSFELSFAAVIAILFIVPRLSPSPAPSDPLDRLHRPGMFRRLGRLFYLFVLVTMAATLGTIPISTFYFNTLSLTVIAGNLLLIPVMGYAVTFLSIGVILSALFSTSLAVLLIKLAALLVRLSVSLAERLSSFSYASIYVATPTFPEIVFYLILIIAGVLLLEGMIRRDRPISRHRTVLSATAVGLALIFFLVDGIMIHQRALNPGRLSVTFLDVSQGNASLVRLPDGRTILIDGGGFYDDRFDIGRNVIAPFLWHEKITTVDTVILTHPHPDHLYGLIFILQNFGVRQVITNGAVTDDEHYADFQKIIADRKIACQVMRDGDTRVLGPVMLGVFNPFREHKSDGETPSDQDLNDGSLVVKITFHRIRFLFPGDISGKIEERLVNSRRDIRADVLLAAHHGSRTSNTLHFVKAVHPRHVIFSCGKGNLFRLPDPEIVNRYRLAGAGLWRTDQQGAITIEADPEKIIRIEGFVK